MRQQISTYRLTGILLVVSLFFCFTSPSLAVVVESQSANTEVILDATGAGIDIEDPPVGTAYLECTVVEWRDADAAGAPDWTPTGSVDGSTEQAWLRNSTAELTTTTTVASDAVTFNLEGDTNDGRCRLSVDGNEVAVIDMWDSGHNRVLVIVRNLPKTTHTLLIDDIGPTQQPPPADPVFDDDIALYGGAAVDCPPCLPPAVVANISSRYIEIIPDATKSDPVAFHVECGTRNECDDGSKCDPADPNACLGIGDESCDPAAVNEGWVKLLHWCEDGLTKCDAATEAIDCAGIGGATCGPPDYDDGGGVFVNIGVTTPNCADADFLTPDEWTSVANNPLYVTGKAVCPSRDWYVCDDGRACDPKDPKACFECDNGELCDPNDPNACLGIGDESCDAIGDGICDPAGLISRPTVTARCVDCAGPDADSARPDFPTWRFCDSSGDGQTTFVFDLFTQFANSGAAGAPGFTGPNPGIEVDTQGNWDSVPDQQVTIVFDIFQCFLVANAGGGDTWTGPTCP